MSSLRLSHLSVFLILSVPLIYLISIYNSLPQTIPIHFGFDGKPDGYGNKSSLIVSTLILDVVAFGMYLLLRNVHKIDPKKSAKLSAGIMKKIALALVVFFSALNVVIILSSVQGKFNGEKIILPLVGLLFAFLGNVMYSIKQNYFCGFRTPWALENEDNWRQTHQLAGRLWFAGGLIIAFITLFMPFVISFIVFSVIVAVLTIIPFVYSYRIYRNQKANAAIH